MTIQDHPILGKYLGPSDDEIKPGVMVYALMRAIGDLAELSVEQLKPEYLDIELAHARLSTLLEAIYDRDTVRELRLRSHGHAQATSGPLAMREVSAT